MKAKLLSSLLGLSLMGVATTSQAQFVNLPLIEPFNNTSYTFGYWNFTNPTVIVGPETEFGAYGLDSGAVFYNFYNPQGNTSYNCQSPVLINPDRSGLKLQFDFAGCVRYTMPVALPQDFSLDYIFIEASKDSGATWEFIDSLRIGTDGPLNTFGVNQIGVQGVSPNQLFSPTDSQWTTIKGIMLPRGTNKVNLRGVHMNQVNGNIAYLDNVIIDTCYTPIPTGDTIQFDSTYTKVSNLIVNGSNLKWYSNANGTIAISDTTSLVDSNYYYVSQTINGCESAPLAIWFADTTTSTPPVDTSTSINGLQEFQGLKIFPNPTQGQFTIETKAQIKSVEISNILGKQIAIYSDNRKHFSLKELPNGTYFVTITIGNSSKTFKVNKL
ncbi:MAG TPA: T9SS type A sorting domain-containing protein [Edaphocola sp.]|nr:T9SS type A sorting domain-containing protein [Edaphocola sp.]